MDKYPIVRYVVAIRHKESKACRGFSVVDDPQSAINDIKAGIKSNPTCAYALFPADYEIIVKEVNFDEVDSCVCLAD